VIPVVIPVPQQAMVWLEAPGHVPQDTFIRKWGRMLFDGLLSKGYIRVQDERVFTTDAGARFREDHVNNRGTQF